MENVTTTGVGASDIEWRSIIAGATAAAALSVVLFGFGSALGLTLASARPYAGLPPTGIAIFSALWLALVYVSTFAVGGRRQAITKPARDLTKTSPPETPLTVDRNRCPQSP